MERDYVEIKNAADFSRFALQGATKIKIWLENNMNDMEKIADIIKQPIKLEKIMFVADSRSKPHHLQALLSAIEEHNNMHTIQIDGLMFSVLHDPKKTAPHYIHRNIGSLEQFKGLRSPTRYFKFGAIYHQDFNTMFEQTAEVLRSGTNFNQFVFLEGTSSGTVLTADGFKEFCEYFIQNDTKLLGLALLEFNMEPAARQIFYQLIEKSKKLTDLDFALENHSLIYDNKNIFDVMASGNIRILKIRFPGCSGSESHVLFSSIGNLIKNSQKLQVLVLQLRDNTDIQEQYLREALSLTYSLRKLWIRSPSYGRPDWSSVVQANESLIEIHIHHGLDREQSGIARKSRANRKLQNERVRSTILVIYHIARLLNNITDAVIHNPVVILPVDIWTYIFSLIKYPGILMDFGSAMLSVFNDPAVRRVVYDNTYEIDYGEPRGIDGRNLNWLARIASVPIKKHEI
jgi:hypothetical protein